MSASSFKVHCLSITMQWSLSVQQLLLAKHPAMNGGEASKDCEIVLIYKCVYLGPVHECYQPIIHCDYDVSRPDSALVGWTVSGHSLYDQMKTSIQTKTVTELIGEKSHIMSLYCKNVSLSHSLSFTL